MDMLGKIALVTGAAVGTGRAIAERLAAGGAAVCLADVDESNGAETLRRITGAGGRAVFRRADLLDDDQLESVIRGAVDTFGGLDILINNAGGGGHLPPHYPAASPGRWDAVLNLNLRVALLATQLALEPLRRDGGVVINIGSTAGLGRDAGRSPEYAAAKAGLIRATYCLAGLAASHNVRVNCVVPDWVATERAQREIAAMPPAERAGLAPLVELGTLCDEICAVIADDRAAGHVTILDRGRPPHTLRPEPA
jgi:NAD(P)-dependent dehydrogenase (short-subunit alcohol dehydrogenase family)